MAFDQTLATKYEQSQHRTVSVPIEQTRTLASIGLVDRLCSFGAHRDALRLTKMLHTTGFQKLFF